ncbi:hypothetical protein ACFX2K_036156 [Malus domestica]
MAVKDVVSGTSLCSCYVNCGMPRHGLEAFREGLNGVRPNVVTVSSILPACSELKDLNLERVIHGFVVRHGMEENVFVSSALVNIYASCLSTKQAQLVFDMMSRRDVVSLNTEEALKMLGQMQESGIKPNQITITSLLPAACKDLESLRVGKEVHSYIFRNCLMEDLAVTYNCMSHCLPAKDYKLHVNLPNTFSDGRLKD